MALCIPTPEPPADGGYLVAALAELGWAGNNGYGETPLLWAEIVSYAEATGAIAEPWEFRCVRRMSVNYANERNYDSPMRKAPYDREDD